MPAAVTYLGVQLGGTIGAALIMESVAIATMLQITAVPAVSRSLRRSTLRLHARQRA